MDEPARRINDHELVLTAPTPPAGAVHLAIRVNDLHRGVRVNRSAPGQPLSFHPRGQVKDRINFNRITDESQVGQKSLHASNQLRLGVQPLKPARAGLSVHGEDSHTISGGQTASLVAPYKHCLRPTFRPPRQRVPGGNLDERR